MGARQRDFSVLTDDRGIPLAASAKGAADAVGISERMIRYKAERGEIPGSKVGRAWRINLPETLRLFGLYPGQTAQPADAQATAPHPVTE